MPCVQKKGAVEVISLYKKQINQSENPEETAKQKIKEYEEAFNIPYLAAKRGYIDDVILPSETRQRLVDALEIMSSKTEVGIPKKHGNIPL